jgi:hypothetical protein
MELIKKSLQGERNNCNPSRTFYNLKRCYATVGSTATKAFGHPKNYGGGERGSVVAWGTMLQAERSQNRVQRGCYFLIHLIFPAPI